MKRTQARVFYELPSRGRGEARANAQRRPLAPRAGNSRETAGIGSEAYLNSTSQGELVPERSRRNTRGRPEGTAMSTVAVGGFVKYPASGCDDCHYNFCVSSLGSGCHASFQSWPGEFHGQQKDPLLHQSTGVESTAGNCL